MASPSTLLVEQRCQEVQRLYELMISADCDALGIV